MACSSKLWIRTAPLLPLLAGLPAAADELASADTWQFEAIPYLWLTGIRADVKPGPLPYDTIHVRDSSVLKALDFAAMGTLEARKGPWGGLVDFQYVKLGVSNQFLGGLAGGYDLKYDQTVLTMAGFYRALDRQSLQIDVLGGARYVDASATLDLAPSLRGLGRQLKESVGWWNGIIGVRGFVPLDSRWTLMGYLDAGGGDSTTSWQGILGASYQCSPMMSFKFGYRYLAFKRDEQALLDKVAFGGIYAGLGFKF